jgi:ketosteroid isomerase-like protein
MRSVATGMNRAFARAIARGDAAAAAAFYAEDARLLPPDGEALVGRAAAERFWRTGIEAGVRSCELETLELEAHDGTAYEIGRYTLEIDGTGDEAVIDRGKYVIVHKQQRDRSWKWAVDIFNSDEARSPSPSRRIPAQPPLSERRSQCANSSRS